jgi:hypothetical protein
LFPTRSSDFAILAKYTAYHSLRLAHTVASGMAAKEPKIPLFIRRVMPDATERFSNSTSGLAPPSLWSSSTHFSRAVGLIERTRFGPNEVI